MSCPPRHLLDEVPRRLRVLQFMIIQNTLLPGKASEIVLAQEAHTVLAIEVAGVGNDPPRRERRAGSGNNKKMVIFI